jgi:hypothetical protein
VAQTTRAEAAEVMLSGVFGPVDDAQVFAAAAFDAGLREAPAAAVDDFDGFDDHPLASLTGELLPPGGGSGLAGRSARSTVTAWVARKMVGSAWQCAHPSPVLAPAPGECARARPDGDPSTSRRALVDVGFEVTEEQQPSFLFDRSVVVTREVPRTPGYEPGFPPQQACVDGRWQPDPLVLDDQDLIVDMKDKGFLVTTRLRPCGHRQHLPLRPTDIQGPPVRAVSTRWPTASPTGGSHTFRLTGWRCGTSNRFAPDLRLR